MVRGLYRFYLYSVCSALLIFVTIATALLLTILFSFTPLRGPNGTVPSLTTLVQVSVFAGVSWLISGILGGLHYWLIRRDMRNDPSSGSSGVRAFFLNLIEAAGLLVAVAVIGFGVLETRAHSEETDVAVSAASGLTTLAMVALVEWERRRSVLQRGAALVFQRLHFFGVQGILLFFVIAAFFNDLTSLIDLLFFKSSSCMPASDCTYYNPLGLGLVLLWFIACWLVYGLVTRTDMSRTARLVLHGASLALGVGYIIDSVFLVAQLFLQPLFHLPQYQYADYLRYTFISPLLLGILVIGVYHILLRNMSQRGLLEAARRHMIEWSIAGLLLAGTFWWGLEAILFNLFEGPPTVDSLLWITALAQIIAGVSYIPLDLYLRRHHVLDPEHSFGSRRGFVLALLGAGLLALALGGATALYAWVTALLGSSLANGTEIAHGGLATALVGALVAGIYFWTARSERLWTQHTTANQPPAPPTPALPVTPVVPATLEEILDELLAGQISRAEAAARIRGLDHGTVEVDG